MCSNMYLYTNDYKDIIDWQNKLKRLDNMMDRVSHDVKKEAAKIRRYAEWLEQAVNGQTIDPRK